MCCECVANVLLMCCKRVRNTLATHSQHIVPAHKWAALSCKGTGYMHVIWGGGYMPGVPAHKWAALSRKPFCLVRGCFFRRRGCGFVILHDHAVQVRRHVLCNIYMYVCMYMYIYIYIINVCVCVCVYIYIYICIYIHTHIYIQHRPPPRCSSSRHEEEDTCHMRRRIHVIWGGGYIHTTQTSSKV
jgi:hypothetical protein